MQKIQQHLSLAYQLPSYNSHLPLTVTVRPALSISICINLHRTSTCFQAEHSIFFVYKRLNSAIATRIRNNNPFNENTYSQKRRETTRSYKFLVHAEEFVKASYFEFYKRCNVVGRCSQCYFNFRKVISFKLYDRLCCYFCICISNFSRHDSNALQLFHRVNPNFIETLPVYCSQIPLAP